MKNTNTVMKKAVAASAIAISAGLFVGCGAGKYDHPNLKTNPAYPYHELSTFCVEAKQFVGSATDVETMIKQSIEQTMATKGYTKASCDQSDFTVEFYARRTEEKRMTAKPVTTNIGTFTDYKLEDVLRGAVAIHLKDNKNNDVFWKNLMQKESQVAPPEEGRQQRIDRAMRVILEPLPNRN